MPCAVVVVPALAAQPGASPAADMVAFAMQGRAGAVPPGPFPHGQCIDDRTGTGDRSDAKRLARGHRPLPVSSLKGGVVRQGAAGRDALGKLKPPCRRLFLQSG
jgi:hypothetical protein